MVAAQGRPTPQDVVTYARENPDFWLVNGQIQERLISNIEVLHSFLGGGHLDIRNDFLPLAKQDYASGVDDLSPSERLRQAEEKTRDL
jgi:hypothetical protein